MKKLFLALVAVMLLAAPAMASGTHLTTGIMIDAPKLIKLPLNLSLGLEGGKNIMSNGLVYNNKSYFEADKGYFGYIKITYNGTWLKIGK